MPRRVLSEERIRELASAGLARYEDGRSIDTSSPVTLKEILVALNQLFSAISNQPQPQTVDNSDLLQGMRADSGEHATSMVGALSEIQILLADINDTLSKKADIETKPTTKPTTFVVTQRDEDGRILTFKVEE